MYIPTHEKNICIICTWYIYIYLVYICRVAVVVVVMAQQYVLDFTRIIMLALFVRLVIYTERECKAVCMNMYVPGGIVVVFVHIPDGIVVKSYLQVVFFIFLH